MLTLNKLMPQTLLRRNCTGKQESANAGHCGPVTESADHFPLPYHGRLARV